MRPVRLQDLRPDTAAKLARLELVAALLERDSSFNRGGFTSAAPGRRRPPIIPYDYRPTVRRGLKGALKGAGIAARHGLLAALATISSPTVRSGARRTAETAIALMMGLGIAFWSIAASLIAILVLAAPE